MPKFNVKINNELILENYEGSVVSEVANHAMCAWLVSGNDIFDTMEVTRVIGRADQLLENVHASKGYENPTVIAEDKHYAILEVTRKADKCQYIMVIKKYADAARDVVSMLVPKES